MQNTLLKIKELFSSSADTILIDRMNLSAAAWFISDISAGIEGPVVVLTATCQDAERLAEEVAFFSEREVLFCPCHDTPPFAPVLPSPETSAVRLGALYRLSHRENEKFVAVMPVQALAELTIPPDVLDAVSEYVEAGEECDRDALLDWFVKSGYENVSVVSSVGEFCARGSVVDFFTPGRSQPVRLDFFGDFIEEIRLFDPLTQRSGDIIESTVIIPASEVVFSHGALDEINRKIVSAGGQLDWPAQEINQLIQSISSYRITEKAAMLPPVVYDTMASFSAFIKGMPIFVCNASDVEVELNQFYFSVESAWEDACAEFRTLVPAEQSFVQAERIKQDISTSPLCFINSDMIAEEWLLADMSDKNIHRFETDTTAPLLPVYKMGQWKDKEMFGAIVEKLVQVVEQGNRVAIVLHGEQQVERLNALFTHYNVALPKSCCDLDMYGPIGFHLPEQSGIFLFQGRVFESFMMPDEGMVLFTESDIFGAVKEGGGKRRAVRMADGAPLTWDDLKPGIHIVHRDHGIGLYRGLVRMDTGGIAGEYLLLEYEGGDKLYLPVDRLALVQRYTGIEGREPRLDRLGGSGWKIRTGKVKESIHAIAHDLLELYAGRQVREGHAFSSPSPMYRQFEAEFPYEETPDQMSSIAEVLKDMQSPRPMDRLLCGDVGFGKTEVVMRAAFKAVEDGMQVAVLVPTTLLAEQHERTFKRRFRRFPVQIEALSRMKSRKEQSSILKKCRSGVIDIVIGTHRLLQQDVTFRRLGLMIIDEEHRFGVSHKEKFKKLKQNIDCLSLTATPIPRTLQLSLLGIRDMSTINTPPGNRVAVKTFLSEYSTALVKGAIKNELERGGQVFFVHNRVRGIYEMADTVARLVPEARTDVAHGQMDSRELESIMLKFVRGEIDCLVSTTIIESGIDIPSANTIIINRADRIGLAALYQLRGRVGRSIEQAYAYLLVPDLSLLSTVARKRLSAIMDISRVGGGFRLAMKDLQIRGAGNILGVSQSGQIADVGYNLYLDLLKSAIDELRGTVTAEPYDPEVNLNIPALIPEEYLPDIEQRLHLYRRLAMISDDNGFKSIMEELEDRFGVIPDEVRNLAGLMSIKLLLKRERIMRLDRASGSDHERIVITFLPEGPRNPDAIIRKASMNRKWKLLPDNRLVITIEFGSKGHESLLKAVRNTIEEIE